MEPHEVKIIGKNFRDFSFRFHLLRWQRSHIQLARTCCDWKWRSFPMELMSFPISYGTSSAFNNRYQSKKIVWLKQKVHQGRYSNNQYMANFSCHNIFLLYGLKIRKLNMQPKVRQWSAAYLQTGLNNKIHKARRQKSICIAVTTI